MVYASETCSLDRSREQIADPSMCQHASSLCFWPWASSLSIRLHWLFPEAVPVLRSIATAIWIRLARERA